MSRLRQIDASLVQCNSDKTVCSYDGKTLFISKEWYTFQSLKNALSLLLCREDIANALEERENLIRSDVLRDITYGAFYQYFVGNDGVQ